MNEAAEIARHNDREAWRDVANHLRVAVESIEQAQGSLEDLGHPDLGEQLDAHKDALRRAGSDASVSAGGDAWTS